MRLAALTLLLASFPAQQPVEPSRTPTAPAPVADRARLEVVEDLSESLANDLLELSVAVRDRDPERIAPFLADRLQASPFPARPGPLQADVKWIARRAWLAGSGAPGAPADRSRAELMGELRAFLDTFAEIEDARFKVRGARFDPAAERVGDARVPSAAPGAVGEARVGFYVIGRNREGRREWARGTAETRVRKPAQGPWQFTAFSVAGLDSMVATTDLFSEVAWPAGVALRIPAYGTPGNTGFVWHGAAAADFDGDGALDLFVTSADQSYLYLNDGRGRFRDASTETGVRALATGAGPLLLDYDNDGDSDVFLAAVGEQVLLENRLVPDGTLRFEDVSLEAGVAVPAIGFSAAAADVNGDGRLDLYVCSYNRYGQITPDSWFRATNGTPNLLFVSQPDGSFREEARKWRVDDRRWSYAATFADVNEDGRPDLYVANDFGEKALFVHKGDHFEDEAAARGVLDPGNGMGAAFGDFNNDGRLDLHATNMSSTAGNRILARLFPDETPKDNVLKKLAAGNNLYENVGGGRFRDVTEEVGGFSGGWAWGGGFLDFDNDGFEDLFTPNGFISGKSMKDT